LTCYKKLDPLQAEMVHAEGQIYGDKEMETLQAKLKFLNLCPGLEFLPKYSVVHYKRK